MMTRATRYTYSPPLDKCEKVKTYLQEHQPLIYQMLEKYNCILAGGYARNIMEKTLGYKTEETNDLDFFVSTPLVGKNMALEIVNKDILSQSFFPQYEACIFCGTSICTVKQPNLLSKTKSVDIVVAKKSQLKVVKTHLADIIITFDFTPTQIAFFVNENNQFQIKMTPAFWYAFSTKKMYLSFFQYITWPLETIDTFGKLTFTSKCNLIKRFFKYKEKGFDDVLIDKDAHAKFFYWYNTYHTFKDEDNQTVDYETNFAWRDNIIYS